MSDLTKLTELIRDANREITPADRHLILDLIGEKAARIAELEAALTPAIDGQQAEPYGYVYTIASLERPHDLVKRFSTYRFPKPESIGGAIIDVRPVYTHPESPDSVRRDALEEAIVACRTLVQENDWSPHHAGGAEQCIDAIRALSQQKEGA